jgi:hypothetical protein
MMILGANGRLRNIGSHAGGSIECDGVRDGVKSGTAMSRSAAAFASIVELPRRRRYTRG